MKFWDRDWRDVQIAMMDFEGSPASGVVEFGIVLLRSGEIESVESGSCAPSGPIASRDAAVHRLTELALANRLPFEAEFERFQRLRHTAVFAAHNQFAENAFLKRTWAVPREVPDWQGGLCRTWGPWVDTLAIYRNLYPMLPRHGLADLVKSFHLAEQWENMGKKWCPPERAHPHAALYDALGSALLLLRFCDLDGFKNHCSLRWLFHQSGLEGQQEVLF